MLRIHLDSGLGGDIDDLCALALLLRLPGVEITGITTTAEVGGRGERASTPSRWPRTVWEEISGRQDESTLGGRKLNPGLRHLSTVKR